MAHRRQGHVQPAAASDLAKLGIAGDPGGCPGPDTPEFQSAICKKLATLTKVINTLHICRTEHQYELDYLKYEHAKELRNVRTRAWEDIEAARTKSKEEHTALKRKESELLGANENLREELRRSRAETQSVQDGFAKFRSDAEQRETDEKEECERQVWKVTQEAERQAEAHRLALSDLNTLLDAERQQRLREIAQERQRAADEREDFTKQLVVAREEGDRKVEEMRAKFIEEAMATYRAQQQERTGVEEQRRELEEKLFQAEKRRSELEEKCVSLQESKEKLTGRLALGEREREVMLEEHQKAIRALEGKLRRAEESSVDIEAKLSDEKSRSADLDTALKEFERLQCEHSDLLATLCTVRTKSEQTSAELMDLSAELSKVQAEKTVLAKKHEDLEAQLETANQRSKELASVNEKLQAAQTETTAEQNTRLKDMQTEIFRLREYMKRIRAQYARELEALQAEAGSAENDANLQHAQELNKLREQHKEELSKLRESLEANYSKQMSKSAEASSSQFEALKVQHDHELDDLRSKLAAGKNQAEELHEQLERLQAELKKSQDGLGSSEQQLVELVEARTTLEKELVVMKANLEGEKQVNTTLRLTLDTEKKRHEEQLKELRESSKMEFSKSKKEIESAWISRLKERCESLTAELRAEHKEQQAVALQQLSTLHKEEKEQLEKKRAEEKKQLEEQISSSVQRLSELRVAYSDLEKEHKLLQEKLTEVNHRLKVKAAAAEDDQQKLRAEHTLVIEELKKTHEAEKKNALKELQDEHQQVIDSVHLSTQLSADSLRASLLDKHAAEIEKLTATHRQKIEEVRRTLWREKETALDNKEEKHRQEIQSLNENIETLKNVHKGKVASLDENIKTLRDLVSLRCEDIKKLEDECTGLRRKGDELERKIKAKEKEIVVNHEKAEQALSDLRSTLAKESAGKVAGLRKEFAGEVLRVEEQAEEQRKKWLTQFNKLQEKLTLAEERYTKRESRPEDLDHIHALKSEIQDLKKKITELKEQKKLFGLELENREQSLRLHFAHKPIVGVLDPLAHKKLKKSESQRRSSAPTAAKTKPHLVELTSRSSGSIGELLMPTAPPPSLRNHVAEAWAAGEKTLAAPDNLSGDELRSTSGLSLPRRLEPLVPSPRQPRAVNHPGGVHTNGHSVEPIKLL